MVSLRQIGDSGSKPAAMLNRLTALAGNLGVPFNKSVKGYPSLRREGSMDFLKALPVEKVGFALSYVVISFSRFRLERASQAGLCHDREKSRGRREKWAIKYAG